MQRSLISQKNSKIKIKLLFIASLEQNLSTKTYLLNMSANIPQPDTMNSEPLEFVRKRR